MAMYEDLMKKNIADAVQAMGLKMDYEGKVNVPYHLELDNAWVEHGVCKERQCLLWKDIIFDRFKVIHPGCISCWKTYVRIDTVKELFRISDLQREFMEKQKIVSACKAGIETRPYTGNLGGYAAFWYNPLGCGLDKARENTRKLSKYFGVPLSLKRGCTEMEQFTIMQLGMNSSQWDKLIEPARMKLEVLENTFIVDPEYKLKRRPEPVVVKTMARWIRFAAEHGDKTYLRFTDGNLIPELRQYYGSIDTEREIDNGSYWREWNCNSKRYEDSDCQCDAGEQEALVASLEEYK